MGLNETGVFMKTTALDAMQRELIKNKKDAWVISNRKSTSQKVYYCVVLSQSEIKLLLKKPEKEMCFQLKTDSHTLFFNNHKRPDLEKQFQEYLRMAAEHLKNRQARLWKGSVANG